MHLKNDIYNYVFDMNGTEHIDIVQNAIIITKECLFMALSSAGKKTKVKQYASSKV